MNEFNFTSNRIRKLKNTTLKDENYSDTGKKGLQLRLSPSDKKTFRLRAWNKLKKKTDQIVIGEYPSISVNDARLFVDNYMHNIASGIDLVEQRKAERAELTIDELFDFWLEQYAKPKLKRWTEEERRYNLYIRKTFGGSKRSEITPEMINAWKVRLLKQKKQRGEGTLSPGVVHRISTTLSSIFTNTDKQLPNPVISNGYRPQKRTIFLGTEDLKKFFEEIKRPRTPQWLSDYLLISLYTGARRSNVLAMSWGDVDLHLKLWIIPSDQTKNLEAMIIPLMPQAIEILKRRKSEKSSTYIFPSSKDKTGHITEPKRAWKKFLSSAGLSTSFRLHDIRRTLGSWQAIKGSSTKLIGASLGHKSEQATAHYAHLTIEPVRESMQRAIEAMHQAEDTVD